MALTEAVKANFQTLCRAIRDDNVCLMECTRKDNGEPVDVICAVHDLGEFVKFVPLACIPRDHVIYDLVDAPEE